MAFTTTFACLVQRFQSSTSIPEHLIAAVIRSCQNLDQYERILIAPVVEQRLGLDFGIHPRVWRVPHVMFHGYHPDLCYLAETGPLSTGPLGHYHSVLAYAAFRCGLNERRAATLYREDVFETLGYFDTWDTERETLLNNYERMGFDLGPSFAKWSGNGPFMHTINHPQITCLRDLACIILKRAGIERAANRFIPHDNLAQGPIFPVYPEIGSRLGVNGNFFFKPGGRYRFLDLGQYLNACFEIYRRFPEERPTIKRYEEKIAKAIQMVTHLV